MNNEERIEWARGLRGRVVADRYRLDDVLGVGGMGAVMLATHVQFGRRVAIKILLPVFHDRRNDVERFRREAEHAASVGDAGVVDILDYAVDADVGPFLVMELLLGQTLTERLRAASGGLTVYESVFVVDGMLRTLGPVHRAGIVHRDLKPSNVFLTAAESPQGERVVLVDFGLARLAGPDGGGLTAPGMIVGTPRFMSPEQARGWRDVDHRSDLYATGLIAYTCLSGRVPYDHVRGMDVLKSVVRGPPTPLLHHCPDLPRSVATVIDLAISTDRDQRFQSADAFRSALHHAVYGTTVELNASYGSSVSASRDPYSNTWADDPNGRTDLEPLTQEPGSVVATVRQPSADRSGVPVEAEPKASRRRLVWFLVGAAVILLAVGLWASRSSWSDSIGSVAEFDNGRSPPSPRSIPDEPSEPPPGPAEVAANSTSPPSADEQIELSPPVLAPMFDVPRPSSLRGPTLEVSHDIAAAVQQLRAARLDEAERALTEVLADLPSDSMRPSSAEAFLSSEAHYYLGEIALARLTQYRHPIHNASVLTRATESIQATRLRGLGYYRTVLGNRIDALVQCALLRSGMLYEESAAAIRRIAGTPESDGAVRDMQLVLARDGARMMIDSLQSAAGQSYRDAALSPEGPCREEAERRAMLFGSERRR